MSSSVEARRRVMEMAKKVASDAAVRKRLMMDENFSQNKSKDKIAEDEQDDSPSKRQCLQDLDKQLNAGVSSANQVGKTLKKDHTVSMEINSPVRLTPKRPAPLPPTMSPAVASSSTLPSPVICPSAGPPKPPRTFESSGEKINTTRYPETSSLRNTIASRDKLVLENRETDMTDGDFETTLMIRQFCSERNIKKSNLDKYGRNSNSLVAKSSQNIVSESDSNGKRQKSDDENLTIGKNLNEQLSQRPISARLAAWESKISENSPTELKTTSLKISSYRKRGDVRDNFSADFNAKNKPLKLINDVEKSTCSLVYNPEYNTRSDEMSTKFGESPRKATENSLASNLIKEDSKASTNETKLKSILKPHLRPAPAPPQPSPVPKSRTPKTQPANVHESCLYSKICDKNGSPHRLDGGYEIQPQTNSHDRRGNKSKLINDTDENPKFEITTTKNGKNTTPSNAENKTRARNTPSRSDTYNKKDFIEINSTAELRDEYRPTLQGQDHSSHGLNTDTFPTNAQTSRTNADNFFHVHNEEELEFPSENFKSDLDDFSEAILNRINEDDHHVVSNKNKSEAESDEEGYYKARSSQPNSAQMHSMEEEEETLNVPEIIKKPPVKLIIDDQNFVYEGNCNNKTNRRKSIVYSPRKRLMKSKKSSAMPTITITARDERRESRDPLDLKYFLDQSSKERLQYLQEMVTQELNVIHQTTNALSQCCRGNSAFAGSMEAVECNRIILMACKKREAHFIEMQQIRQGRSSNSGGPVGHLSINDIRLPLKKDFMSSLNSAIEPPVHYFVVMVRSDSHVIFTPMMSTHDATISGAFEFPTSVSLDKIRQDFSVDIEIYGMSVTKDSVENSPKKKKTPIKAKKMMSPKSLLCLQSPCAPQNVRMTNFINIASVRLTAADLMTSEFPLERIPYSCPLKGSIQLNMKCVMESTIEQEGFLTMFEVVNGFGAWHRRWFQLKNHRIAFWKYPNDVSEKEPVSFIDLKACISDSIGLVSRDVCARPNTFELKTAASENGCLDTNCIEKHWLSADTAEERRLWCSQLNEELATLRAWHSDALRPFV